MIRNKPVLRLTIPDGEMELGVVGVPGEAEEAGVAGVAGVTGVDGAGGGDRGVGTALKTPSFWRKKKKKKRDFLKKKNVSFTVFIDSHY